MCILCDLEKIFEEKRLKLVTSIVIQLLNYFGLYRLGNKLLPDFKRLLKKTTSRFYAVTLHCFENI